MAMRTDPETDLLSLVASARASAAEDPFASPALAVALGGLAMGGWSLLDLSERRFRFVSAVTHELRTPLTTLRLYIDLMLRGVANDGPTRTEYLETMSAATLPLYERHGFAVVGETDLPGDGPHVWAMRREPDSR